MNVRIYIYTLSNDVQVRSNAHRIMMEDIRAREDDATRLQTRARIASMDLALGLEVVEVAGDGNCFLHAARFALLQLHGWNYDLVPTQEVMRAVFVPEGEEGDVGREWDEP